MTEKVLSVLGTMVLVVSFSACPPHPALSGEPPKEATTTTLSTS